jgi:hypothetical protein
MCRVCRVALAGRKRRIARARKTAWPNSRCAARPRLPLLFRNLSDQAVCEVARGRAPALHKFDIPVVMEVARVYSFVRNKLLVPAGVVVIGGVERLMQVADEVQQELERQEPLGRSRGRVAELGRN